ncbi:MAG: amino acid adenylation domain-containing protein [Legionella sp.]|uniref:amino acid adenylation domain-containing protein n=1 Tax=Legionella sp. TaxID=459 RepID=UPI0039E4F8A5
MNPANQSKKTADRLIHWIRDFSSMHIDSHAADEQRGFPPHVFLELGNQGFFGIHISQKYGGLELTTYDMLRVIEQVASIDLTLSVILIESIQGAHTLENYASESMKNRYLNQMATGRIFTAGAMTESDAGSNPRAMKSVAKAVGEGEWLLKGSKRWIGMGSSAALTAVYVQQYDENNHWVGMSGFLVPQGTTGMHVGLDDVSMGIRGFSKNKITLDNVKVTSEQLLGRIGEGMEIAQDNMMYIRLCLAAAAIGAMKRCAQLMYRYAQRRVIATGVLLDNPVTLVKLSEITAAIDALDSYVYRIAALYDEKPSEVPEETFVVAKILGSELLSWVADQALQLLGARGYEATCDVSKIFRDARVFRIFEGPTEALNMYLGSRLLADNPAFEQFICHILKQPQLFKEIQQVLSQIREQTQSKKAELFVKPLSTYYWSQAQAGEVSSYAVLLSCLQSTSNTTKSDNEHRSILWVRSKYDDTVKKILSFSSGEQVLMTANQLGNSISDYELTIGNIDQNRNYNNVAIDPLLQACPSMDLHDNSPHELFTKKTALADKISSHSLTLSEHDRFQLLHTWNNVEHGTNYPERCVHHLFEEQALKNGQASAVVFNDCAISYMELNKQANKVAHYLHDVGIGPDKLVALYFERSIEMIIGVLGVLKSGAAYLPLDYNYPEKSLAFMLEDSGASLVLSQNYLLADCPFESIKLIGIEDILERASTDWENDINISCSLDSAGYVIYTSGSTGQPKGVMLPHKALSNLMYWHREIIPGKRNVLQFTTLNFDMSFIEIFSALGSGGALTLISEHDRLDVQKFSHIVKKNAVDQLVLSVPFLKNMVATSLDRSCFKDVKEIIIAGEQLVITDIITGFFKDLGACQLYNYYGPAETHVVTSYLFPQQHSDWPDYPPIGKPISNSKILILDDHMQLVPPGSIGEIYIGGACLAKGYINRAELTQGKFVPDPFSNQPDSLLYRSGDCGKYLSDGTIVYTGRKDEQLKIRGYRIEPQEIEWHLMKYPGVKEAVVIAKKSSFADKHLEAFLIMEGSINDNLVSELYTFLQEHVPPHLLPSVFNMVEKIPLTNSGKVDRIALEQYEGDVVFSISNVVEPESETEKALVGIMENIFKIKIGVNHSFLFIGGNSLLAMQITSEIRERFLVNLPAYSVLSEPSIADIAKRIDVLRLNGT